MSDGNTGAIAPLAQDSGLRTQDYLTTKDTKKNLKIYTVRQRHSLQSSAFSLQPACWLVIAAFVLVSCGGTPQVADSSFVVNVERPEYAPGSGPVVLIDEAHNNFHTVDGRYATFVRILRADGYVVRTSTHPFRHDVLEQGRVMVIANALSERNITDWTLPTPSAFTRAEIDAVDDWVLEGGSLFLIADHMPFGGAASDLADRFGIEFTNSYDIGAQEVVADITPQALRKDPAIFLRSDDSLLAHSVTDGRSAAERVASIATFTGQGFNAPDGTYVLLRFGQDRKLIFPTEAWVFSEATPSRPAAGMAQGAVMRHGQGRVAVFGEAAMFTAQLQGAEQAAFGLNSDKAKDNAQLLLNVMHWLDGSP